MPDMEKIKEKIRKIERLAESPVPEEADAARRMAEKIRKEYGVFGSLDDDDPRPSSRSSSFSTESLRRRIFIKRYVIRDRSDEEWREIREALERVANNVSREYNMDCEIRWNTSTETETYFIFFKRSYTTIWISMLAPSEPMLARMRSLFLALIGSHEA